MESAHALHSYPSRSRAVATVSGLIVLALLLFGLFSYKWGSALRTVEGVRVSHSWATSPDKLTAAHVLQAVVYYFKKVWLALVYGILIGAVVHTFISPRWIAQLLSRGGLARRQATGGLAATPLMLCSCCITPIFTSVYERGARLGSALSLMLGSPGLNLAALILTFLLFPLNVSLARLGGAITIVFILPILLERAFGPSIGLRRVTPETDDDMPRTFAGYAIRFTTSLGYLLAVTVPLIVAGVVISCLILPKMSTLASGESIVALVFIGAVAVLVALPTFFEIPLALVLMNAGLPGAAAALLVAGPIINLPSLFVLGRETKLKVAGALALGTWVVAIGAGMVAQV
jgi:uncharacterized protein